MDDDSARPKPSRRQALVTAGLAAVAVPLIRPRHRRPPRPTPDPTPSPEPTPTPTPSPTPVPSATDPASALPYITGLAGTPGAGYFTDQNNNPRLWVASETWGLPVNAGQWTSPQGNWQSDFDTFFSERAAQGFTICMTDPVWAESGNNDYNGNTWDGVTPLVGGSTDPSSAALNSTFWTRIDYMLTSAAENGITIGLVLNDSDDPNNSADLMYSWTTAQWTAWATQVATRYACTPSLIWLVGNDAFSPYSDSIWNAVLSGLSAAGDSHLIAAWYNSETTSRYLTDTNASEDWGISHSAFNFCYTYNASYFVIEYAYGEVANEGAADLLPVVQGDGFFYQGDSGSAYYAPQDRFQRQWWWWALADGARGILAEAENTYQWASTAPAAVTGDWPFANNLPYIVSLYTSLPGWNLLMPDLSSSLVTGGRGSKVSGLASGGGGGSYSGFGNSWVAASITPTGSLAVLYLPNATTITINESLMQSRYTAKWVDPVSGATSPATPGSTYNSTAQGSNSQGDPDWVLVLQTPPQ
jgi:hypothetical protein